MRRLVFVEDGMGTIHLAFSAVRLRSEREKGLRAAIPRNRGGNTTTLLASMSPDGAEGDWPRVRRCKVPRPLRSSRPTLSKW
jgi:hypothetical protein